MSTSPTPNTMPKDAPDWFSWVSGRLRALERHRHDAGSTTSNAVSASGITINSATITALPGSMTVTVDVDGESASFRVSAYLDCVFNSGTGTFSASLYVDGVQQSGQANASMAAGSRVPIVGSWVVTNLSEGSHVFQIRANIAVGTASVGVQPFHSHLMVSQD